MSKKYNYKIISRIDPYSAGKMAGCLFSLLGVFVGLVGYLTIQGLSVVSGGQPVSSISLATPSASLYELSLLSPLFYILLILFYGIFGFFIGFFGSVLYNWIGYYIGWVKIKIKDK